MSITLFGARIVFAPGSGAAALAFIGAGIVVGTISGLTPGLHVNALAMLLAIVAPSIPGPPHLVGATLLAAGVTHSFLDIVPSLTHGVPDAAMAASTLPGHRLVLDGRGHEALRLSVLGSTGAVALALVLGVPVTIVMTRLYSVLRDHLPLVLAVVMLALVTRERSWLARAGAVAALLASGVFGIHILDANPVGVLPVDDVLLPAFAGLFGVPILLAALRGAGVPEQHGFDIVVARSAVGRAAVAGAGAGGVVGYIPGVSSAIAAVLALASLPGRSADRGFIVTVSGVTRATPSSPCSPSSHSGVPEPASSSRTNVPPSPSTSHSCSRASSSQARRPRFWSSSSETMHCTSPTGSTTSISLQSSSPSSLLTPRSSRDRSA